MTDYPENPVVAVLAELGPLPEDALVAELKRRGSPHDDPEDALGADFDSVCVVILADGRWAWLPGLLAGRVFTHRLSAAEIEHDALNSQPDLDALGALLDHDGLPLPDGSRVIEVVTGYDDVLLADRGIPLELIDEFGILLPPGTLRDFRAGDLLGVRVTSDGLRLEQVGETAEPPRQLAGLLLAGSADPVEIDGAIWTACAIDPELFTDPLPPFGELADAVGLAVDGDWLAAEGFDFAEWRTARGTASIAHRYDLSEDEALSVQVAVVYCQQVGRLLAAADADDAEVEAAIAAEPMVQEPGDREALAATAAMLADPVVAEAVLLECEREDPAALGLMAESLEAFAPREARPALRWLRAHAHERMGDVLLAERTFAEAESMDPEWPLTLLDVARYAGDRGDAVRALSLLRRAGVEPGDRHFDLLQRFQPTARADVGRNDPCWCGSGRKYKKCHLGREESGLEERALWLYQKANQYLAHTSWRGAVADAIAVRTAYDDSDDALDKALQDPLMPDAVLFEDGAFEDFVETRGMLLPDDERLLADQWLLVERSVFEVDDVRPGDGLVLRDLRTGDVHDVREHTASRTLKRGQLLCARVVPTGTTMQIFGGIEPVGLRERDALMELLDEEPTATELVDFLSRRFAPPELTNTEGESLLACEATLEVGDPAALAVALDDAYDRAETAEPPRWIEHVTTQGMRRVRATLRLEGTRLWVEANSAVRFERVLSTLRSLDPMLRVVEESRRDLDELAAAHPGFESPPEPDPEMAEVLRQFVRDYERKWLDESIPALAGLTPRQAADDPTRRDDLIRLLDSFPVDPAMPGAMNPDRIRADLGLN